MNLVRDRMEGIKSNHAHIYDRRGSRRPQKCHCTRVAGARRVCTRIGGVQHERVRENGVEMRGEDRVVVR